MICKNYAKIQLGAVQTDCMQSELCRLSSYVIIKNLEFHRKSRNYFNKRERERETVFWDDCNNCIDCIIYRIIKLSYVPLKSQIKRVKINFVSDVSLDLLHVGPTISDCLCKNAGCLTWLKMKFIINYFSQVILDSFRDLYVLLRLLSFVSF